MSDAGSHEGGERVESHRSGTGKRGSSGGARRSGHCSCRRGRRPPKTRETAEAEPGGNEPRHCLDKRYEREAAVAVRPPHRLHAAKPPTHTRSWERGMLCTQFGKTSNVVRSCFLRPPVVFLAFLDMVFNAVFAFMAFIALVDMVFIAVLAFIALVDMVFVAVFAWMAFIAFVAMVFVAPFIAFIDMAATEDS